MVEEEEEHESEKSIVEWAPICYPSHHHRLFSSQPHHRSLSDSHTHFNGCSSIGPIKFAAADDDDDTSIVFPPINHEGLHTSALSIHNHDPPPPPPPQEEEEAHLVPPEEGDTGPVVGAEVARWVSLGLGLVRSRVTGIVSSLRHFAGSQGANWSFSCSATGVAAALVVLWLYVEARRRRRKLRIRKESVDHLIVVIKEKDEKINQLLHQIAQMNQILLALHKDSTSRTGGLTK